MSIETSEHRVTGLRVEQRDHIVELIGKGARLVTVVGLGGIGKTTLAADVVAELQDRHPDISASRLRVGAREGSDIRARLIDELSGAPDVLKSGPEPDPAAEPRLVVIDGGEHLLDNTADLQELLATVPALQLLITSRVPLEVPGEITILLRGLDTDDDGDSMALFRTMARAYSVRITPDQLPRVRDILRRLGGYPLAIRLCVAQLQEQSLAEVHGAMLARPDSTPPRSDEIDADLRRVIEWSLDRQTGQAVRLLRLLSVFNGWCTIDSIEAIAADVDGSQEQPSRPIAGRTLWLAELIDAGLVDRVSAPLLGEDIFVYRVHDSVRVVVQDYAVPDAQPLEVLVATHRRWYAEKAAALASDAGTRRELAAFELLQAELPEFTIALDALIDASPRAALPIIDRIGEFWVTRGRMRTGARLMRRALQELGEDPDGYGEGSLDAVLAQSWLGHMKLREGAPLAADAYQSWLHAQLAPMLAGASSVTHEHFALAVHFVFLSMAIRKYPVALTVGARCRELAIEAGDDYHAGLFSFYLARVSDQAHDLEGAILHIRRAIVHVRRTENESFLARCLSQEVLLRQGQLSPQQLIAELAPIPPIHLRNRSFKDAALISIPLAIAYAQAGQTAQSLELLRETLALSRRIHYFDGQLYAVILIAFADLTPTSSPENLVHCARLYGGFRPYLKRFAALTANNYMKMLEEGIGALRTIFGQAGLDQITAQSATSWPQEMAEADAFAADVLAGLGTPATPVIVDPTVQIAEALAQSNERERELLDLVLTGITDKQIAERLDLKPNTVRSYNSRIFRKFGVSSRTELLALFRAEGY